jgi:hypothetical protein
MFNITETERSIIEFTTIMGGLFIFALLIPNIATFLEYGLDKYLNYQKNEEILSDLEYRYEHRFEYIYEKNFKGLNEKIVLLQEDIKNLENTINVYAEIVQTLVDRKI